MVTKKRKVPVGFRYELSSAQKDTIHCAGPLGPEEMAKVFRLVARVLVRRMLTDYNRVKPGEVLDLLPKVVIDGVEFDQIQGRINEGMIRFRYALPPYSQHYRVLANLTSQNGGFEGVLLVKTCRRHNRK